MRRERNVLKHTSMCVCERERIFLRIATLILTHVSKLGLIWQGFLWTWPGVKIISHCNVQLNLKISFFSNENSFFRYTFVLVYVYIKERIYFHINTTTLEIEISETAAKTSAFTSSWYALTWKLFQCEILFRDVETTFCTLPLVMQYLHFRIVS